MSSHTEPGPAFSHMSTGALYDSMVPELAALRRQAHQVVRQFNRTPEETAPLLRALFGRTGEHFYIEPVFFCDYGKNIFLGDNFYANTGLVILDACPVTIGDFCMIGPQVGIYTATHPVDKAIRRQGLEYGKPIAIGDDVWIGGHVTIAPGVTIGSNVVVAAGSVVVRDLPDHCVAAGNPAKIIRRLDETHGIESGIV